MTFHTSLRNALRTTALVAAAALVAACSTDTPTAPNPDQGGQGPGTGTGSGSWSITVTATPSSIALPVGGEAIPNSTIQIRVRNAQGAPPPNGTTAVVTLIPEGLATLGSTGASQAPVSLFNGEATLQLVPTGTPGTVTIRVQLEGSVGQATVTISAPGEVPAFMLSHVDPNTGSPAGGDVVTIHGANIVGPVRVVIDGRVAEVLSVSSTRIRVRTPPASADVPVGSTRPVDVQVTSAFGTTAAVTDTLPGGFIYTHGGSLAQPTIFSLTPTTGPKEGGTQVRINGSGFEAPVQVIVTANGVSVEAELINVTSSQILFRTPPVQVFGQDGGQPLSATIAVVNLNSGLRATAEGAFQYTPEMFITSIGPGEGPAEGGTLVTIFGQGFDEPVAVEMGGVAQEVVSVTGTEILVRTVAIDVTGCNDVTGPTRVVNIESGASATGPSFRYRVRRPVITGISPSSGDEDGGFQVTISGGGFESPVRVTFGTATAPSASVQAGGTQVVATAPPFNGTFPTQACDDNADGTQGERFVAVAVDVTVTNQFTACADTLADGFRYIPDDQTCRGDVAPVTPPEASFTFGGASGSMTVNFTDTSSGTVTSRLWNFGDGTTSTVQNPTKTYAAPGTYTVTLTVTNSAGSDNASESVTVPLP